MEESGTGKEQITKAILDKSGWKNNRMPAVNCMAAAQSLIESE